MATGTIKSYAQPSVDYRNGTNTTTTVPSQAYTNLVSLTLPAGVWLILGHVAFTTSFDEQVILAIRRGSSSIIDKTVVRGTGSSGGGLHTAIVEQISSQTTYNLAVWQGNSASKTADQRMLQAVRMR